MRVTTISVVYYFEMEDLAARTLSIGKTFPELQKYADTHPEAWSNYDDVPGGILTTTLAAHYARGFSNIHETWDKSKQLSDYLGQLCKESSTMSTIVYTGFIEGIQTSQMSFQEVLNFLWDDEARDFWRFMTKKY